MTIQDPHNLPSAAIALRVIPDGIRTAGFSERNVYRVSVSIVPDVRPHAKGERFPLATWPREIDRVCRTLSFFGRPHFGVAASGPLSRVRLDPVDDARVERAQALWTQIFCAEGTLPEGEAFEALRAALAQSQGNAHLRNAPEPEGFVSYSPTVLADHLEDLCAGAAAAEILQRTSLRTGNGQTKMRPYRNFLQRGFFRYLQDRLFPLYPTLPSEAAAHLLANRSGAPSSSMRNAVGTSFADRMVAMLARPSQPLSSAALSGVVAPVEDTTLQISQTFATAARSALERSKARNEALYEATRFRHARWLANLESGSARRTFRSLSEAKTHAVASRQRPQTFLAKRVVDPLFWTGKVSSAPSSATADDGAGAFVRELARMEMSYLPSAAPSAETIAATDDEECSAQTWRLEAAGRKFMGIQSHPILAKFLGLTIEFSFEAAELAELLGRETGSEDELRVDYLAASHDGLEPDLWTACKRETATRTFLPATLDEAGDELVAEDDAEITPHRNGLLDLQALHCGEPRFSLHSLDAVAFAKTIVSALHAIAQRFTSGAIGGLESRVPFAPRTRGIALVDKARTQHVLIELARAKVESEQQANVPYVLASEHLAIGYRIDVGVAGRDDDVSMPPPPGRWRSLCDRIVRYDDFDRDAPWLREYLARDHAVVRSAVGLGGPTGDGTIVHETLCTWMGESLAVRSLADFDETDRETPEETTLDRDCALNVGLAYGLSDVDKMHRLPPLRYGRRYWFGARLVYAHGGSLSLADAATRYASGEGVLGTYGGQSFRFERRELARAPQIHLPDDDPIIRINDPDQRPGDAPQVLVVRSGRNARKAVSRWLAPPRTDFDTGELHGLFDDATRDDVPDGAFRWIDRDETGNFPTLNDEGGPRGSFVRPCLLPSNHAPYYPDPISRRCHLAFVRDEGVPLYYDPPHSTQFWRTGESPVDAALVRLRLRAAESRNMSRLGAFHAEESLLGLRSVPSVSVILAPAEDVELWVWSPPEPEGLESIHWLVPRALELAAMTGADRSDLLETLRGGIESDWSASLVPLPFVSELSRIRLIHAVDKPLDPPRFDGEPVGIRIRLPKGATARDAWSQYVAGHANESPRTWQGEEEALSTFFVGALGIDRASTAMVRCDVEWLEYSEGNAFVASADGVYRWTPSLSRNELFRIENVPREGVLNGSGIDLLKDESGMLRAISYSFGTPAARRLKLRLVATSRFVEFFPKPSGEEGSAAFERTSLEVEPDREIWIQNTLRPSAPRIDFRVLPIFDWEEQWNGSSELTITRTVRWRLHHPPPFHDAGEGTLLAIACLPGGRTCASGAELMESLGALEAYTSRWGTDPRVVSAGLADVPDVDRFQGRVPAEEHGGALVAVPVGEIPQGCDVEASGVGPGPDGGPRTGALVEVAAYRPELDPEEGMWRFDIAVDAREMDGAETYFPWVRLQLCRFQPHSAPGCALSLPQERWLRVPPKRTVRVSFVDDHTITIEVNGPGYWRAGSDDQLSVTDQEDANTPKLRVLLQLAVDENDLSKAQDGGIRWKPVFRDGRESVILIEPYVSGKELRWVGRIDLPESRIFRRYGLHLSEVERWPQDSEDALNAPPMLVDGYVPFACEVDLRCR